MKILVACEFYGRVRDAFIKKGHDAMSCDLLPTELPGPHYQGDVLNIINDDWDMILAFPPCTHLCSSGARWWPEKKKDSCHCGYRSQMKKSIFIMRSQPGTHHDTGQA